MAKRSKLVGAMGQLLAFGTKLRDEVIKRGGSDEDLDVLLEPEGEDIVIELAERLVPRREFFIPILDADISEQYKSTLSKYRLLATEHGVPATTPVCYRVKAGFTLMSHAPKAGPCHEQFKYLQDWNFPDESTTDSLVFWVPRILAGSTSKTKDRQVRFLTDLRVKLDLPAHHLSSFGGVALVAGLILAHYQVTQERIPLNQDWVRTDTCAAGGFRLYLGEFDDAGLYCYGWDDDDSANDSLGVFALGVEAIGQ